MDNDVSIFIIDEDNNYIDLEEYKVYGYKNGMFVCLTNDELNKEYEFNNSICIYKDWRTKVEEAKKELSNCSVEYYKGIYCKCKWQDGEVCIPHNERFYVGIQEDEKRDMQLKQYIDGYLSCQNIMSNVSLLLQKVKLYRHTYLP